MSARWFKTRDGLSAVIFATDHDKHRCYIGAYMTGNEWYPTTWTKSGRWHDEPGYKRGLDLIMNEEAFKDEPIAS